MKRLWKILASSLSVILILGLLLWGYIGRTGTTNLEAWIGNQIVGVLESYITPEVKFQSLDYQAPKTVVVDGFSLVASQTPIVTLDRIRIELAEVPRQGQPIKIQHIDATRPHLLFRLHEGDLLGWSRFAKSDAIKNPESVPEGQRFSDILELRHVRITDGEIVYQEPGRNENQMVLPGVNLNLDTPPVGNEPGVYALKGTLKREPVFEMSIDAQINLDTFLLNVNQLALTATLNDRGLESLPPSLQSLLRTHDVRGTLAMEFSGSIPMESLDQVAGNLQLDLSDARVAMGDTVFPVGHIKVRGALPDGRINLEVSEVLLRSGGRKIFSVEKLTTTLAGLPTENKPLDIESVEITQPYVALLQDAPGDWRGWSDLIPSDSTNRKPPTTPDANPQELPAVYLRHLQITDATLAWGPSVTAEPMEFRNINLSLGSKPTQDNTSLHTIQGNLEYPPWLRGGFQGTLDAQKRTLDLDSISVSADFGPSQSPEARGPLSDLLARHNLQTQIRVNGHIHVPLTQPENTTGALSAEITDVRYAVGEGEILADRARINLKIPLENPQLEIQKLSLRAGQTQLASADHVSAHLSLADSGPQLERLVINSPHVHMIRNANNEWVGWSTLLPDNQSDGSVQKPVTMPAVQLKSVEVTDGGLTLQPSADQDPFTINGIEATLSATPEASSSAVAIQGQLIRKPLLQADFDARLDTDSNNIAVDRLTGKIRLADDSYAQMPVLKTLLGDYAVTGDVGVRASGSIPLNRPEGARGEITLQLRGGEVTHQETRFPAQMLTLTTVWPAQPITVQGRGLAMKHAGRTLLSIDTLDAELAGLAKPNTPLIVTRARLVSPRIELIQNNQGELIGWNEWLAAPSNARPETKSTGRRAGPSQSRRNTRPAQQQNQDTMPVIRSLSVENGVCVYGTAGEEPMVLGGINATLRETDPNREDAWHDLDVRIARPPAITATLSGKYHIQQMIFDISDFDMEVSLTQDQYSQFPPRLQTILNKHAITGNLTARFAGRIPIKSLDQARGNGMAELRNASFATGDAVWSAETIGTSIQIRNGVTQAQYRGRALDGELSGKATLQLPQPRSFDVQWNVTGVNLEETLRTLQQKQPEYSGVVTSSGSAQGQLQALPDSIRGKGVVTIRDGRLINLPVIKQIVTTLSKVRLGFLAPAEDNADFVFDLTGRGIQLNKAEIQSSVAMIRGKGLIRYDGELDLEISADVMNEINKRLGQIGAIIEQINDRALRYTVTGSIDDPKVGVRVMGLGS